MNIIEYKNIPNADNPKVVELFDEMLRSLSRPEFFYRSNEDRERLFDETYQLHIGAYDGEKLVGMASLFVDQNGMAEYRRITGVASDRICEFGNYIVLPEYRSRGIIGTLQNEILKLARELKFEYAVAAAHPENFASVKVLSKIFTPCKMIETDNGFLLQHFVMKIE